MKGASLIGELIALLFMVVLGYFLGGLIAYTHRLNAVVPNELAYDLTVEAATIPIKHENLLLAFLETTYDYNGQKIPMKRLLTEAVLQDSKDIRVNGIDEPIHVDVASVGI